MMDNYFDGETFSKIDFTKEQIKKGEYDNCTFENCNFENVHASNIQFVECEFINCNFSNAIVKATAFKDVFFDHCKMIGVKFNECDSFLLQLRFNSCQLDFSSFYQLKMTKTVFVNCSLVDVDFSETNLEQSVFDSCNLKNAIFDATNLVKVDFTTALNLALKPSENRIKGAVFSKTNVVGLLREYQIEIK
jgi:uncharacterized protein YjbI with pentapeptide repeats